MRRLNGLRRRRGNSGSGGGGSVRGVRSVRATSKDWEKKLADDFCHPFTKSMPNCPTYYSLHTSFTTEKSTILLDIAAFLKPVSGIETSFEEYIMRCGIARDDDSAVLCISLFRGKSEGQFLVEMQRESGCPLIVRDIVETILEKFNKEKI